MRLRSILGPSVTLGLMTSIAGAQQAADPAPATARSTGRDYKIAVWYEADHPTTSIKYQVYDLAKGEYDAIAVRRWLDLILSKYPDQGAYVRDIRTEGLPGSTEAERLAHAIENEKARWADVHRKYARSLSSARSPLELSGQRGVNVGRSMFDRPSPGSPGGPLSPPASPFPYPYRSGPR
jgi:hypothetical protein